METPEEIKVQETSVQNQIEGASSDPFSLDEARLSSLTPEQRAALDPVFDDWKKKAQSEIERYTRTSSEKYKPLEEKAQALDQLVKDPRFVQWWNNLQQVATNQGNGQVQMQDFATPEEWQQAVSEAYAGDGRKMQMIQGRMFSAMATPVVQQLKKSQEDLKAAQEEFQTIQEMKDLFSRYPDAKELDAIGRDPRDSQSESLLEQCLNWADEKGLPLEQGYQRARNFRDALRVGAKQEAMGLVQDKKQSTLSGSTTAKSSGSPVVEVQDAEELMEKNMEAILSGVTPPRFVIKPGSSNGSRWAQKT